MTPSFGLKHWIRRPSLWIAVLAVILAAFASASVVPSGYLMSLLAQVSLVLFVLAPATAAATAWEGSRFAGFHSAGVGLCFKVFGTRVLPFAILSPCGYVLTLMLKGGVPGAFGSIEFWLLLGYCFVVGICWTFIGGVLGMLVKPIISIVLAAALAYGWYAVIPALQPGPIRRVAGDFLACCSLDVVLDRRAVAVATVGVVGFCVFIVGATLLLRARNVLSLAILGCGVIVLGGAFASSSTLNVFGTAPRDEREVECVSEVCAWPEIPEENRRLNTEARTAFAAIAPESWQHFAQTPVRWGDLSAEHLSLSSQPTIEGVLGEFVDQAGLAELAVQSEQICGVPAAEVGAMLSGLPWTPGQQVDSLRVKERIEQSICGKAAAP